MKSSSIRTFLQTWPLFVLLLPLFFVLHGVRENFGFILAADYFPLIIFYWISSCIAYFLFYLFYRNRIKAGILTLLLFSIFFFYGFIQDFLKVHLPSANRYIILLPLMFTILIVIAILMKRSKNKFTRITLFFNCLFLVYIFYDFSIITAKTISPQKDKFSVYPFSNSRDYNVCDECIKPDIYFLVFDEYASSLCLKNDFNFDNSQLDSFLINHQFRIQTKSSGNYNFTPFSVSSILNMSYISGINADSITGDDYARCNKLIRENEVAKYLSASGYDIVNCSIFDIAGNPAPVYQDFLPVKAKLITDRTLWGRMKKDILWNLFYGKFEIKWLANNAIYIYNENNQKLVDLVKAETKKKSKKPRFIYAHYNMPHPPYYFDRNGKPVGREKLGHQFDGDHELYLEYVGYTNSKIKELVNSILSNTNNAVIIVMGDHGFRNDNAMPHHVFLQNQNAIYLPGKNYNQFYDSITGVNQFRVLFNTLFKQNIPLLKDSTSFLKDAH